MDACVYLDPTNWCILQNGHAPFCADTFFVLPTCCDEEADHCSLRSALMRREANKLKPLFRGVFGCTRVFSPWYPQISMARFAELQKQGGWDEALKAVDEILLPPSRLRLKLTCAGGTAGARSCSQGTRKAAWPLADAHMDRSQSLEDWKACHRKAPGAGVASGEAGALWAEACGLACGVCGEYRGRKAYCTTMITCCIPMTSAKMYAIAYMRRVRLSSRDSR